MVNLPEKAPNWLTIIEENPSLLPKLEKSAEVHKFIQKANQEYLYWDELEKLPPVEDIDKRDLWTYLRFLRDGQMYSLPFMNLKGRPFRFWVPNEIQKHLHFIDKISEDCLNLDDPFTGKKGIAKYKIKAHYEEAINSAQIAHADIDFNLAKDLLVSERRPRDKNEKIVHSLYQTLNSMEEYTKEPLSINLLKMINASITSKKFEGNGVEELLRTQNVVPTIGDTDVNNVHIPPSHFEITSHLDTLCQFINEKNQFPFIHPVIKASFIHFWINYVKPFADGNGRTARALIYWVLIKEGYWLPEYLSISKVIQSKPGRHFRAFINAEMDEGDLTYFAYFNTKCIVEAIENLKYYINDEQSKSRHAAMDLKGYPELNIRQARIVQHALTHPNEIFTITKHQNTQGLSYQTARTDLIELEKKALLRKVQKGKAVYYIPVIDLEYKIKK